MFDCCICISNVNRIMKNHRLICFLFIGLFLQDFYAQEGTILFPIQNDVYYFDTISKTEKLFIPAMYWPVSKIKIFKAYNRMYWINPGSNPNTDLICNSRLDGSGFDTIFKNLSNPGAFDADPNKNILVWTDLDDKKIYKSKLDGSERNEIISNDLFSPLGIILDTVRNKIIWSDRQSGKIKCANYDGGDIVTIIDGFTPTALQLDYKNEKIYWIQNQDGEIYRANLDGTDKELVMDGFGMNTLSDISLDVKDSMLYCSRMTSWDRGDLLRINLETKDIDTLSGDNIIVYTSLSIHFDPEDEEVYWADTRAQTVSKLNLQTDRVTTILCSDVDRKERIIYRDSILFYLDYYINYYDVRKRFKKTIDNGWVSSLAVDSLNNIYWYNYDKDSIMCYDFSSGNLKGLLPHNSDAFGKMEWLADNSLLYLDMNSGFFRYDLDEKILYTMGDPFTGPTTFAVDDKNNLIYIINGIWANENIECIDYHGNYINIGSTDKFSYVRDMEVFNDRLFIAKTSMSTPDTTYIGGLDIMDLSSFDTQMLSNSISLICLYILRENFNSLPAYSNPSKISQYINKVDYRIFPNPNNGEFQLEIEIHKGNPIIEIFNSMGAKMNYEIMKSSNLYYITLQEETTANGLYFVRITEPDQISSIPFILIR